MNVSIESPWFDKWTMIQELGRGGQGITHLLEKTGDATKKAVLKTITERWKNEPQARDRLKQEAETLSKLRSAGADVPEVYDSFLNHADAEPFVLMEYIDGIRFDEWLQKSAPVSLLDAITVTRAIAVTMKICHEQHVGHRDLKPANIILRKGEIGGPCVIDFGISFDSKQSIILTKRGEMFRNEFITLPEGQDLTGNNRDLRSDITALACIFFTCLTSEAPITLLDAQGQPPHRRHEQLLNRSIESIELRERLRWFFDKAFSYMLTSRVQTLAEFETELAKLGASLEVEDVDIGSEFETFDKAVQAGDRRIQIISLIAKFTPIRDRISNSLTARLGQIQALKNAKVVNRGYSSDIFAGQNKPLTESGDTLATGLIIHTIGRDHFNQLACATIAGLGVGMTIHVYGTSYISPVGEPHNPREKIVWTKLTVLDANATDLTNEQATLVLRFLENRLAAEIKTMTREVPRSRSLG
jgi:serine/threonine protein kinase